MTGHNISSGFQKSCEVIRSSRVKYKSLEPGFNIYINVTGIHFNLSVWFATDIGLKFTNCDLKALLLLEYRGTSSSGGQLLINASQISSHMSIYDTNATIENCTAFSTNVSQDKVLFNAINSAVTMKSMHIEMFQGRSFLQVSAGSISIENSKFVSCASVDALLKVSDDSFLSVCNSTFIFNDGALIRLKNTSTGILNYTKFEKNSFVDKSSEFAFGLVRVYMDSVLMMDNCSFFNNTAHNGASVAIYKGIAVIENSHFLENRGSNNNDCGVICVENTQIIQINNSILSSNQCSGVLVSNSSAVLLSSSLFHNNSALHGGGVLLLSREMKNRGSLQDKKPRNVLAMYHLDNFFSEASSLINNLWQHHANDCTMIQHCTFVDNSADSGGAIYSTYVTLVLNNNTFVNNTAAHHMPLNSGGAVYLQKSPTNVTGCLFHGNNGLIGGAVYIKDAPLNIDASLFVNNGGFGRDGATGGAIQVLSTDPVSKATLFTRNSSFHGNQADVGGAIVCGGHTIIQACNFVENKANLRVGGAVSVQSAIITGSHFESNRANTFGGAVDTVTGSNVTVSHTSFSLNIASAGGAISVDHLVRLSCHNCSFHSNKAFLG